MSKMITIIAACVNADTAESGMCVYGDSPDRRHPHRLFYFDVASAYNMSSINLAEYAALSPRTGLRGTFIANDHPLVTTLSVCTQRNADS